MTTRTPAIVGELINHAYARARTAFSVRDLAGYQHLARSQAALDVQALTVNLDGTKQLQVQASEMLALLPDVIAAVQDVTSLPLVFDNPSLAYHDVALSHYDRGKGGAPVLNSLAASRTNLDAWLDLIARYDASVVIMASEHFVTGGTAPCLRAEETHRVAKYFVGRLVTETGRRLDQIYIDPGLPPVAADSHGLVLSGLEALRMIRQDPDLRGVHCLVGLSNFTWGTPASLRGQLENAYLTLAVDAGLDYAIANPERRPAPLPPDDPVVSSLSAALATGRRRPHDTQESAAARQAEAVLALCDETARLMEQR